MSDGALLRVPVAGPNDRPDVPLTQLRLELSAGGIASEVALLALTTY